MHSSPPPPAVLVIAGNDPTGGAGLAADIETLVALGCRPLPVVSCITVQDTQNVSRIEAVSPELLKAQAQLLFDDITIAAIKIGLIGSVANLRAITQLLKAHPNIPVILDPILRAGGGHALATAQLIEEFTTLYPYTTLITPNSEEARTLGKVPTLPQSARNLLEGGCQAVMITGAHEEGDEINNCLYHAAGVNCQQWPRLPHSYHGSGCTFAAAAAAGIALGQEIHTAVSTAQRFTWNSLERGYLIGRGQHHPHRSEASATP